MNYRNVGPKLILFIIFAMIGFLLIGLLMRSNSPPAEAEFLAALSTGSIAGFMLFTSIWSGLFGQSWIRSYLEAAGLVASAIGLISISSIREWTYEGLATFLFVPLFGVTTSIPLWFMRYLRGWRLLSEMPPQNHNRSLGIEDILLLTTVIASAIMLSRSSVGLLNISEPIGPSLWASAATASAIFGLVSAPFSLITARIALTKPQPSKLVATMLGFWLFSWFTLVMFVLLLSAGRGAGEGILFITLASMSAFAVYGIGLTCFILDENQLFSNKLTQMQAVPRQLVVPIAIDTSVTQSDANDNVETSRLPPEESPVAVPQLPLVHGHRATDPFSDEDNQELPSEKPASRRTDRVLAVAMLLVSFLFSLATYWRGQRESAQLEAIATAQKDQISRLAAYGKAQLKDGMVYQFKARSTADDLAVARLQEHNLLHTLDLSNSKVSNTGAALAAQFQNLQVLDLADTSIDDHVFETIPSGKLQLQSLNLSRTRITGEGLIAIARRIRCDKLIVNGLGLTAAEIDQISSLDQTFLDLRDVQLSSLPRKAKHMHLGSNGLPAESILELSKELKTFQIDSMNVTDEVFDQFIKTRPMLTTVGFANTPQTGKSLASLNNHPSLQKLIIGQGTTITEQDLIDYQPSVTYLEVHDPDFRGSFLGSINGSVRVLDLSDSGVDDKAIQSITKNFVLVRLAHTKVTHKSVQHLSSLGVGEIDIRGTKMNVEKLIEIQFGFPTRLIVDLEQFTDNERTRIERSSNFRLNYEESGSNTTSYVLE